VEGDFVVLFTGGSSLDAADGHRGYVVQSARVHRIESNSSDRPGYPAERFTHNAIFDDQRCLRVDPPLQFDVWLRKLETDPDLPIGNARQSWFEVEDDAVRMLRRRPELARLLAEPHP
jgi:hypothetical protein